MDKFDKKILSMLVDDATSSLASIGKEVGLSAPAVHERIKKLRKHGVIRSTNVMLDGNAVDKPLLAFIHLKTMGWGYTTELEELANHPEFEEVHSVTGSDSMILKVRVKDSTSLERVLKRLHDMESVVSTSTFVTLSTYLERPVQVEVSEL
ncbi:Lrp/AsnC family transcriptional regulator [Vibrio alginolyticus]